MPTPIPTLEYKVAMIGPTGSGKLAVFKRLCEDNYQFDENIKSNKIFEVSYITAADNIDLDVSYIAGRESDINCYKTLNVCKLILIFCDLSLDNDKLSETLKDFLKLKGEYFKHRKDVVFMLVGNKIDKIESAEDGLKMRLKDLAATAGLNIHEYALTSAKTGAGVNEIFYNIIPSLIDSHAEILNLPDEQQLLPKGKPNTFAQASSSKHLFNTGIKHLNAHPWRYGSGLLLAIGLITILVVPGIVQTGALVSFAVSSVPGQVFSLLAWVYWLFFYLHCPAMH